MEFKRISNHKIIITHTANEGLIARVGCARLSFSNPETMLEALTEYYTDPEGMEKRYNAMNTDPEEVVERAEQPDHEAQDDTPVFPSDHGPEETRRISPTVSVRE